LFFFSAVMMVDLDQWCHHILARSDYHNYS